MSPTNTSFNIDVDPELYGGGNKDPFLQDE
jgi:hypothetical protein